MSEMDNAMREIGILTNKNEHYESKIKELEERLIKTEKVLEAFGFKAVEPYKIEEVSYI